MREILFRGRDEDEQWHCGFYYCDFEYRKEESIRLVEYIVESTGGKFEVATETIGQFIWIKDCKGNPAYVGDIFTYKTFNISTGKHEEHVRVIKQCPGGFCFEMFENVNNFTESLGDMQTAKWFKEEATVIGNIHDNPELLGVYNGKN